MGGWCVFGEECDGEDEVEVILWGGLDCWIRWVV